jgi:tetratricopeptide (TPR) repeat protein
MRRSAWWLLTAAGLALAVASFFMWRARVSRDAPQHVEANYVNPSECADCHSKISNSYRPTGMGHSLYRASPQNIVEDFTTNNTLYHRASDRYYTMLARDGKWYLRGHQIGFDGKPTNVVEKQIDYVVGSGRHSRSYLNRTPQGTLIELPVSWYSEKGGYWAMSPGYDQADHDDFRRTIPGRCLACHTAYPTSGQGANLTTSEPVFGEPIPEGIDCQRCHGPGRAHINAAASGHASVEAIRAAIVNPARLSRDRQLEVCIQCHLETTHFALPGDILRYPQQPFSYRPGEALGDSILFFDYAPGAGHDDRFEIVSAAYRLGKSVCFRSSQMTCTTCHDPHSQQTAAHYDAVCRNCHASAHDSKTPGEADSCVECHMPKRRTEDVVHAVMTDHYIQRKRPARDLLKPLQESEFAGQANYRGEVTLYYPPQLPATPENKLYIDLAQVYFNANLKSGIPQFEHDLEKFQPSQLEFYVALGNAYKKVGNYHQAIHWYEAVLQRRPDFRPALEQLGAALIAAKRTREAAAVLEKSAALPLSGTTVLTNLGGAYFTQGNLDQARQVLQRALSLNPDLPEAHNFLGLVLLQQRDWSGAEKNFREAISIQPEYAAAQYNLATTLAGTSRTDEAQYHFEKAIAAKPEDAEAHHHYGVLLAQLGSSRKALAELQEAIRLDPGLADAYSDLATALAAQGELESAVNSYRQAIRLKPDLYEAHLGLARTLEYKGDGVNARTEYEEAAKSPNPDVREAARKALR